MHVKYWMAKNISINVQGRRYYLRKIISISNTLIFIWGVLNMNCRWSISVCPTIFQSSSWVILRCIHSTIWFWCFFHFSSATTKTMFMKTHINVLRMLILSLKRMMQTIETIFDCALFQHTFWEHTWEVWIAAFLWHVWFLYKKWANINPNQMKISV